MGQFPKCIPLKQISGFYCVEIPSRKEKCKSTLEKLVYMMKETLKTSKEVERPGIYTPDPTRGSADM